LNNEYIANQIIVVINIVNVIVM